MQGTLMRSLIQNTAGGVQFGLTEQLISALEDENITRLCIQPSNWTLRESSKEIKSNQTLGVTEC